MSNRTILDKHLRLLIVIAVITATFIGLAGCNRAPEIMDVKERWKDRPHDFITLAHEICKKINDAPPGAISVSEIRGKLGKESEKKVPPSKIRGRGAASKETVKRLDDAEAKGTKIYLFIWSIGTGTAALDVWTDGDGEFALALAAEEWMCSPPYDKCGVKGGR
jgi:hypothetical protein